MMLIHRDLNGVEVYACGVGPDDGDGHTYRARLGTGEPMSVSIKFQLGPVSEAGVNGLTNEALLAVLEHRLLVLNRAPHECHENMQAINAIRQAQGALKRRTMERIDRQVEGTSAP